MELWSNENDLSLQEKQNLSLEMKICFYLCGWNKNVDPQNFEEWIEHFYQVLVPQDIEHLYNLGIITREEEKKRCIDRVREEYNRLYDFVKNIIVQ